MENEGNDATAGHRRLLLASLVAVVTATSLLVAWAASAEAATAPPHQHCGSVLLQRNDWLDGHGVAVHLNAAGCQDSALDYVNNVAAGYAWQCVELVNRLYLKNGWITSTWSGNGNQMYANAPAALSQQPQGSITKIRPSDVISLDSPTSPYGHAAVINTITPNPAGGHTLQIVNQNTPQVYSYATISHGTITLTGWAGWTIIGIIHAPQP